MGVKSLWKVLEPCGTPVPLDSLKGRVLAVDVSIWLNQAVKARGENWGNSNAHLLLLFTRICKLLYYSIQPVFVFDGATPPLKLKTLEARRTTRKEAGQKADQLIGKQSMKLLEAHALQELMGTSLTPRQPQGQHGAVDMYKLPELPRNQSAGNSRSNSPEDSQSDEMILAHTAAVAQVDVDSQFFRALPPEVQHDILLEKKEISKHTYTPSHYLPEKADDFSDYQLKQLLRRSNLSRKLNKVRSCMNSDRSAEYGLGDKSTDEVESSRIASSDTGHYILIQSKEHKGTDQENTRDEDEEDNAERCNDLVVKVSYRGGLDSDMDCFETQTDNTMSLATSADLQQTISVDLTVEPSVNFQQYPSANLLQDPSANLQQEPSANLYLDPSADHQQDPSANIQQHLSANIQQDPSANIQQHHSANPQQDPSANLQQDPSANLQQDPSSNLYQDPFSDLQQDTDTDLQHGAGANFKRDSSTDHLDQSTTGAGHEPAVILIASEEPTESEPQSIQQQQQPHTPQANTANDNVVAAIEEVNMLCQLPAGEAERVLNKDIENLQMNIAQQQKRASHVSDYMYQEAQELLRLFGVPYVVSPSEAEAQCAALELNSLTNGSITDDNDVFLFGGRNVYRHFFDQKKDIEFYTSVGVEKILGLSRDKLVVLAYLLGSDYTEGLEGIGQIHAMEALRDFSGEGIAILNNMKQWWLDSRTSTEDNTNSSLHKKLRQLSLPGNFPDEQVWSAYYHPTVDSSEESFEWSMPDLDLLRQYTEQNFGWSLARANDVLLPVIRSMRQHKESSAIQRPITSFVAHDPPVPILKSKRLKSVVASLTGTEQPKNDSLTVTKKPGTKRKRLCGAKQSVAKKSAKTKSRVIKEKGKRHSPVPLAALSASSSSSSDEG